MRGGSAGQSLADCKKVEQIFVVIVKPKKLEHYKFFFLW